MAPWRTKAFLILLSFYVELVFVHRSEHDSVTPGLSLSSALFENVDANDDHFYDGDGKVDDDFSDQKFADSFQEEEDEKEEFNDYQKLFSESDLESTDGFSSYSESKVESEDHTQKTGLKDNQRYSVLCGENSMTIGLPSGSLSEIRSFDMMGMDSVLGAPESCDYSLTEEQDQNVLRVSYAGCRVTHEAGSYTLRVLYRDDEGRVEVATASCSASSSAMASPRSRSLQSDQPSRPTLHRSQSGCAIPGSHKLECAASSSDRCLSKGCCVDVENNTCYYPMNECTADGQFVFTVSSDVLTVNPMSLAVPQRSDCKPVKANKDFAIFKFGVSECGTHCYNIGDTTVYLAELQTVVRKLNLKYGVITRDSSFRLLVECRYPKMGMSKATAGYMVMSATQPSMVTSEGLFGIQILIAEDKTFSRFYPHDHQPLRIILGRPVYLEVRLNSPNPRATLLVHYCVAYTRSAKNALVLLHEGCPNPLDSESASILYTADLPQNRHKRRFEVKAFQFMDQSTNKYLNEEIYFMCSTEVCLPSKTPCKETCFDGKS
ncbi:zona pellucida sperm-binding protein 1 [Brachyhypopomus gauderio]|uniref:zona pellucida sperm-binding protein 1 n=1 Tax=Brachyhypopomus gauderio TaxID=698409 RepID=UPI0040437222